MLVILSGNVTLHPVLSVTPAHIKPALSEQRESNGKDPVALLGTDATGSLDYASLRSG